MFRHPLMPRPVGGRALGGAVEGGQQVRNPRTRAIASLFLVLCALAAALLLRADRRSGGRLWRGLLLGVRRPSGPIYRPQVTLRVKAIGLLPKPEDAPAPPAARPARKGERRVFDGEGWRDLPVWDRDALTAEDRVDGPAIVEEPFATHFIAAGWSARLGPAGALLARRA